jgi:pyrroline-5-carboxylate reductase
MGGALLRGWLKVGIAKHIYVLEPQGLPEGCADARVSAFRETSAFIAANPSSDVTILAVKPQIMETACKGVKPAVASESLVLSIAAGKTIAALEAVFGSAQPIVRVMPNTPAAIGKGISVAVANPPVAAAQKKLADNLLHAAGLVEWITDENLMDAVTAVSGSGPAYVFLLIEAMAEAGEKAGLPAGLSMKLARQTVIGSAALAEAEPDISAAKLRENVTSPNGTTAAALKVLMDSGEMQSLFDRAIAAAVKRGKELNG